MPPFVCAVFFRDKELNEKRKRNKIIYLKGGSSIKNFGSPSFKRCVNHLKK